MNPPADECARELIEVVPLVMRVIRCEMRSRRTPNLSVPQFRVLAFLSRQEGASLSAVAEHLGLTLPSTSKLVDGLVTRSCIVRRQCSDDRRRVRLALTEPGRESWVSARHGTQAQLTNRLTGLSSAERGTVLQAMRILRSAFAMPATESG